MTEELKPLPYTPCKAMSKQAGRRCRLRPIPGGEVCSWHGGKAPQVKAAAERVLAARQIQQSASAVLAHEGVTAVEDPLQELGKLASSAKAMMDALGARVNALGDIETFDEKRAPHIRVAVELYERAMDRTHRLLDSLVKHGYTERQVAIAESEAMLVAGVIRRVVAGLGLTTEQQELAQTLLAEEFRALEGAAS
jgi:hypothetical protein